MTAETVYTTLVSYLRKDKRGNALSIDEFNRISVLVDRKMLMAFGSRFEEDVEISSHMGFLKVIDQSVTLTTGVGSMPTNYYRLAGDPWYTDGDGIVRWLDVRTSAEHSFRERDYLTKATAKHPSCVLGDQDNSNNLQIRVYPTTIGTIYINYIRNSVPLYLDYYVNNTTLQPTFMAVSASVPIPSGSTYRDGTTGTKTSLTTNPEWDDTEFPWLMAFYLQYLGVTFPEELLTQIGKGDSAELQNKEIY